MNKRKEALVASFRFRSELFSEVFKPHLDERQKLHSQLDIENFHQYEDVEYIFSFDDFLWETTEILLVSISHWAEHELKSFLRLCKDAGREPDTSRLTFDGINSAYKRLDIYLQTLNSYAEVDLVRLVANSIKHNGSYPKDDLLDKLGLKKIPEYNGAPTVYSGILVSETVQEAILKKLRRADSQRDLSIPLQQVLVADAIAHIQTFLEDLINRVPEEQFSRVRRKNFRLWPPSV